MKESWPGRPKTVLNENFYTDFHKEDQRLMREGSWDYIDPETPLNKLKSAIESINDATLTEERLNDKEHALWLWYHHASQVAYGKHNDIPTALDFINKALFYRERIGLDNQITPLLKLLYVGDLEGAKRFAETIPDTFKELDEDGKETEVENVERETAQALIDYFEKKSISD